MLLRRLPLLALPCLLLAACANDIRVTADWDPATANLAARKTFAFAGDKACGTITPGRSVELRSPPYRERVNRAILAELAASGRAEATVEKAQLVVTWDAASDTVHEYDTTAFRNRMPPNDPWYADRYETRAYLMEIQTLTVTLKDGPQGKALWTGSVRAPEIAAASPDDREKRIRELVRRLFEKLPKPAGADAR